jgi:hypothetical protein
LNTDYRQKVAYLMGINLAVWMVNPGNVVPMAGPERGAGRQSAISGNSPSQTAFRFAVIRKARYRSRFFADFVTADV